ncbi:MAG: tetratricopeptide repeat protein [Bacteroidetes bacterium]|nr:tetratricopeptide repeat protein [Bacteroidota bacterium]MBS1607780.1 tetratricopeptide repeat protein [Bacteroidota bacterium]
MADKTTVQPVDQNEAVIAKAKDFWSRYGKLTTIVAVAVIVLAGGYLAYKYLYKEPNEVKAADYIYKAEEYYRQDSVKLALNGDGLNPGFLKVISRYGNTEKGNLAKFYAGDCYLKLGDNVNAVKYLKDFSTSSKLVQARAYKLLGDAYADQGKNSEAFDYYKKAAGYFEEDNVNTPEYLFMAAYFADKVMKNSSEAISLYKKLKEKYPNTDKGLEADKYLAMLGVYKAD